MFHELSYANEKLHNALHSLVGGGSVQDRLFGAFMSFHPLQDRDFKDPEMLTRWQEIYSRLTVIKDGDPAEGAVKNTLNRMSDEDAENLAGDILELAYMVKEVVSKTN